MQYSLSNSLRSDIKIDIFDSIPDDTIELFKYRYLIEERVSSIAGKYEIKSNHGLRSTTKALLTAELINRRTYEYVNKVLAICNRSIHGEIIDDYYLEYVTKILPEILNGLSAIRFHEMANTFHECKKCGFENICSLICQQNN